MVLKARIYILTRLIFSVLALFSISKELQAETNKPKRFELFCEDRVNPIGIDDQTPDFRWILLDTALQNHATAFQIHVADSEEALINKGRLIWDSGKLPLTDLKPVSYNGKPLKSQQRSYWKLLLWVDNSEQPIESEIQFFEMGLLSYADWRASWIWNDSNQAADHIYLRHDFSLPSSVVKRGRIYVSGSHHYQIYLNQKLIGKGPNFSDSYVRYYQTFEVDPKILYSDPAKKNQLIITAHWIGAGQSRIANKRGVLFKMDLRHEDNKKTTIISDKSWQTHQAEWFYEKNSDNQDNIFRNSEGVPTEYIDGRKKIKGVAEDSPMNQWQPATIVTKSGEKIDNTKLIAQNTELEEEKLIPLKLTKPASNYLVADFGKVFAGTPRLVLNNQSSGKKINLWSAYRLNKNGHAVTEEQNTNLLYQYITRGDNNGEVFEPFWYLGGRYLAIENAGNLKADQIQFVARHNYVQKELSSFQSSDAMLNKLWDLAYHSTIYGAQEQYVDTPTREQGQFSYDSYLIGTSQSKLFAERRLNQQALKEFARSQARLDPVDGRIDAAFPNGAPPQIISDWVLIWPLWAYEYYLISADTETIREIYPALERTGNWIKSIISEKTGLIDLGNKFGAGGLIDWPDNYQFDLRTSQRSINCAYAVAALKALAEISQALGELAQKDNFNSLADKLKKQINKELWDEASGSYVDGLLDDGKKSNVHSEATNATLISLGIASREQASRAVTQINPAHPKTSVVLSRFIVHALTQTEKIKELFDYLRIPNGRNFAQIIKDGGTFTYESWQGYLSKTGSSESHAYGARTIIDAIVESIAGIKCLSPGCRTALISPQKHDIKSFEIQVPTSHGSISVSWNTKMLLAITIPPFTTASVCLKKHFFHKSTDMISVNENILPLQFSDNGCAKLPMLKTGIHYIQ